MNALKLADANQSAAVSAARSYNNSRSLGTILTPGTDTDLSIPIADLKLVDADSLSHYQRAVLLC